MKKYGLHSLLFVLTVITTTLSGAEWIYGKSFLDGQLGFEHFKKGILFSIPFLSFLTAHEFGHFFMAKIRRVRVSLPYYLPAWLGFFLSIGTFGAFIKIKSILSTKKEYFDIGIAGPLTGFVVSVVTLIYGFTHLPNDSFIYSIHPEYHAYSGNYREWLNMPENHFETLTLGKPLLYQWLESTFADPALIPHPYELSHYPILLAGLLGLLFTAINLLPIGQLDGGHILYALVGRKVYNKLSPAILVLLVGYSGLGLFTVEEFKYAEDTFDLAWKFMFYIFFVYLCFSKISPNAVTNRILALSVVLVQLLLCILFPGLEGYTGIMLFAFLIGCVLGVYHPPTFDDAPIGLTRKILGWLAMLIFILCFTPNPIS